MIKVACVGCGSIHDLHCRHLNAIPDVKVAGHCDIDEERAKAAARLFGGDAFTDYQAMFEKVKPQAVYVCLPPYAHNGVEESAAGRGIHLFVEKPIGLDRAVTKRVAAAVRQADILCSVAYCFRYSDTVALARQILKGKPISLVSGLWNGVMPRNWWWRRMDKSGGQLVEQTTHLFDLIRYLCGEIAEIYAVSSTGCMTKTEGFDIHDSCVATLRLKNGATGVVASSCVSNHPGRVSLEIVTPDTTLTLQDGRLLVSEAGKTTQYAPGLDMYEEETKVFLDAVRTGKRNRIRSTYGDAYKTFALTLAACESIRSGLPVKP
ncbi:MAG: Gfo/Idh/MocA family oxidoreductase [Candidatus Hydrogenedentes bacterium]|nr:Gfo/Idh/MocA family oxidoreductase [Candidatus Hydrogenedentota bacterium]